MTSISVEDWGAHEWESYAIGFWCDTDDLEGAKHYHSWEHLFSGVAGRASFFKDDDRKIAVLTFRGGVQFENWKNSISAITVDLTGIVESPSPEMRLHQGFLKEYLALKPKMEEVRNFISKLALQEDWRILLTGHSMGGALATICAADLILNKVVHPERIALVTFGSPRTGNQTFAQMVDTAGLSQNIRVEIVGDIFALLPRQHGVEFYHRGQLTQIKKENGAYIREEIIGFNPEESGDGSWSYFSSGWMRIVEDFFTSARGLDAGLMGGAMDSFNTHVSYHRPYKSHALNRFAFSFSRGQTG
jgi:hypothetical protein